MRIIEKILLIVVLTAGFIIPVYGQSLEQELMDNGQRVTFDQGFSILVPQGFVFNLVEEEQFDDDIEYLYQSDIEQIKVLISKKPEVDAMFEAMDNSVRKDIDFANLTNQELTDQSDRLMHKLYEALPFYMSYQNNESKTIDNRLLLTCEAFYTDDEKNVTAMVKAVQFYYMGNIVTLYYDTVIKGQYFDDQAFLLFDLIVDSLNFEYQPTTSVKNNSVFGLITNDNQLPTLAIVVAIIVAIALVVLSKSFSNDKESQEGKEYLTDVSQINQEVLSTTDEPVVMQTNDITSENVDWNTFIIQTKNEISLDDLIDEEKQVKKPSFVVGSDDQITNEIQIECDESIDGELTTRLQSEIVDENINDSQQNKEQICRTQEEVDQDIYEVLRADSMDYYKKYQEVDTNEIDTEPLILSQDEAQTNDIQSFKDDAIIQDVKQQNQVWQLKKENIDSELDNELQSTDEHGVKKLSRKAIESDDYINKSLEQSQSDILTPSNSNEIKALQEEMVKLLNFAEKENENLKESSQAASEKSNIKLNRLGKILNNIAHHIVSEPEDIEELADVNSRHELHKSEKVEKNMLDDLIPGITDAHESKEVIDIEIDEFEEMLYITKKENDEDNF